MKELPGVPLEQEEEGS
jgi:hypothetical protein